jgi:hypothetical protein
LWASFASTSHQYRSICACCATVGLVRMRCEGRQKLYRTNAEGIRPLHEWTSEFEKYWTNQLNRVKERAEKRAADRASTANKNDNTKEDR